MTRRLAPVVAAYAGSILLATGALAFPTVYQTGTTVHLEGVTEGYVIYGGQEAREIHMVDLNGNEVHRWTAPCGWTGPTRPLANGHILNFSCGNVVELDWDSNVVWQFNPPFEGAEFHHDVDRLPNGNTLILARQRVTVPEISPLEIFEDFLLEVSPAGDIVWEWHEVDHFDEFGFSQERKDAIFERGLDWSHANTASAIPPNTSHADPRFRPGNVILSVRHQNAIAIIDRATGEIVWTSIDQAIGPHDTHMLPDDVPGGGNILVFDNGFAVDWAYPRNYSRVIEINPVTGAIDYDYDATDSGLARWLFYATFTGGMSRMANGNTMIVEGNTGRIFEVLPTGERVWEYVSPYLRATNQSNVIYRAYKVPYEWGAENFSADLVVSGTADTDPVQAGDPLGYTIQVQNMGQDPAVAPQVSGSTPAGTTFQSLTAPPGWNCSTPLVGSSGPFTCSGSELSAGATEQITLEVMVDFCTASDTLLSNATAVSSNSDDATPGDNTNTIQTSVTAVDCSTSTNCMVGVCDEVSQSCVEQPLSCSALDACHVAGVCDQATGACSNPVKQDGELCDDNDGTTCGDFCAGGTCGGEFVEAPIAVNETLELFRSGGSTTVSWNDTPGSFNVYQGTIVVGTPYAYNHTCLNEGGPTSEMSVSADIDPESETIFYYLATRVEQCRESVSGYDSTGSPRVEADTCG